MLIKQHGFNLILPTQLPPLFVLSGAEVLLVERFKQQIKHAWLKNKYHDVALTAVPSSGLFLKRQTRYAQTSDVFKNKPLDGTAVKAHDVDYQRMDIVQPEDWQRVALAFNHYSLFSELTILDVSFDKKNLDQDSKLFLRDYLDRADFTCLLILYLPQLTSTNLKFLSEDPRAAHVLVKMPGSTVIERWISDELHEQYKQFPTTLPRLIYQYTQGNLLACSQVIEKIKLAEGKTEILTENSVLQQLEDQCHYQLYELRDNCLAGDTKKALRIFRFALENRYERTLILWIITQEIRLLMQLFELNLQQNNWQIAIKKLQIWPSRAYLYQNALQRIDLTLLTSLLSWCSTLDQLIKTSQSNQIDCAFELLIVSLCLGKEMNPFE